MAKAKMKAKTAVPRPRAKELPGIEGPGVAQPRIQEIDDLADDYIKERDKRLRMTPREVAAKLKLIDALHTNAKQIGLQPDGTLIYRYDTVVITLEPGKEKLKVKDVEEETEVEL